MAQITHSDLNFLKLGLTLAEERKGYTAPNPAVGAVVVKDGQILGKGFHWASGFPHAEVEALREISNPEGATLYVSLEPCCHFGKTPPCTDLILEKKIKRVVYGYEDPNPTVCGLGAQRLREAGVEVEHLPVAEINDFYRSYQKKVLTGACWMTGKLALTRDGKTGKSLKTRFQISGKSAGAYTHFRRNQADVLLTSVNTVSVDDPLMNVRLPKENRKKPVVILDRLLTSGQNHRIFAEAETVSLVHSSSASRDFQEGFLRRGCDLVPIGEENSKLKLAEVSIELGKKGFLEAWCEVGPRLFSAFGGQSLFDEIVLLISQDLTVEDSDPSCVVDLEWLPRNYLRIESEPLDGDTKEVWRLK